MSGSDDQQAGERKENGRSSMLPYINSNEENSLKHE